MILSKIRGVLAMLQFIVTIAGVIILMFIFRSKNHTIRRKWSQLQIRLLGVKIEEFGQLDKSADMLLLNHQSLLDIVVMEKIHSRNIAWVAKKEIGEIPFYGNILRLPKMIEIDRENKAGIIKLLKDVKQRLEDKRVIALFPEGTRSDGTQMLKFKSGAKIVANKYNLKVQPVVVIGTRKVLDSKKISASPGEVKIIYLDPIVPSENKNWYSEVEQKMQKVFESYQ